jgi:exonuclease SbcC
MMILCSLKLENFKRYKEFEIELFEGLTGFIGRNGSGKSTIFDAIFFALYGELRAKNAKSYVRHINSDDKAIVVVELIFEVNAIQYKVVREFRGKTLVAKAYLYDSSQMLLANGSKEVDKKIQNLIGMPKKAFLNTVFASQKELTSLSQLDNEERKKLIRKLLGLEKIDNIEKKIRENLTNLKRDCKSFTEILLDEEKEKEINSNIDYIKLNLKDMQKIIDNTSLEYSNITNEQNIIYKKIDELQKEKENLSLLQKDQSICEQKIANNIQNINKLRIDLKELENKQKDYKEKQTIKEIFKQLEVSIKEQEKFKENFLKQEGLLKEQSRLRVEFKRIREEIHNINIQIKDIPVYKKEIENLNKQIDAVKKSIELIQKSETSYSNEIAAINSLVEDCKNKVQKLQDLGQSSECPTCTRPLLNEYDNVLSVLNNEISGVYAIKISELEEKLNTEVTKKKKTILFKEDLEKKKNDISSTLKLLDDKLTRLKVQQDVLQEIEKVGRNNNDDLSKIKDVKYDKVLHKSLQEQYKVTRDEYEFVLKLEEIIKNIPKVKKDLELLQDNEVTYTQQKLSIIHLIKEDKYDCKFHELKQKEYKNNTLEKEKIQLTLRKQEKEFEQSNGNLKALIEQIKVNKKNKNILRGKQIDFNDFEKLKVNLLEFKTRINSKVAPRISQIASSMYSIITRGKYQHIEVTNEFDFNVYDDGKSYPIDRFSGGEIDLANLVLRIAISKTLSELNGSSQIGFLAFDEIFGSQDDKRREEIMNAFMTIKEEYRQIFLISHESDIKELFEYFVEIK